MKSVPGLMVVVLVLAFVGSGCATMEGFGKDIQKVGDKIESKAKKKGSN